MGAEFGVDEEKRSICEQALAPGVSVAHVAHHYSMNANSIFKWLKSPRFSPATGETPGAPDGSTVFLPVEIAGRNIGHRIDDPPPRSVGSTSALLLPHSIDITLSDGWRLKVEGARSKARRVDHGREGWLAQDCHVRISVGNRSSLASDDLGPCRA